jgi:hypothetical protein
MNKALDLESGLEDSAEIVPVVQTPTPTHQLHFLPTRPVMVAAGGRAAGGRTRQAGGRFNKATAEDLERYAATAEEREHFIANDPVVRSAAGRDPVALLGTLKAEVAREAAALVYQRIENEKMGKDISQVSGRRIDALKKIADIEMEMRKIGFDQLDVHSEKFQRVFKLWIETIRSVAEHTLNPEQLDLFFNRLSTEMEGWEDKAEELVR